MIITRTPFRISFVGGGSDFQDFYSLESGAVISTTIDKYIFLSMHPLFNKQGYFLKYSDNELVDSVDQIQHPIIKEVFKTHKITGVDFNSSSDVPAGTGLGSSSSFTVGLINLCYTYNHTFCSKEHIAEEACDIEINKLKSPIGKQDQYAASVGGLNYIQFNSDDTVHIERLLLSEVVHRELESSLMLLYLGNQRSANSILMGQQAVNNYDTLKGMAKLATTLRDELKNNCIDNFGEILHANWCYKKELANGITNSRIDSLYLLAIKNGAEGGKLLGAGGTGFLLLYAKPQFHTQINKILNCYELPFKFENSGTTVIY